MIDYEHESEGWQTWLPWLLLGPMAEVDKLVDLARERVSELYTARDFGPPDESYARSLAEDIEWLGQRSISKVALAPGWRTSRGTLVEIAFLQAQAMVERRVIDFYEVRRSGDGLAWEHKFIAPWMPT